MIVDIFMNVDPISRNFESFSRFTINDINKFVIAFAGKFTEIEKYQREMRINNPEYLVSDDRVILKYHIKENQNGIYYFRAISNTGVITDIETQKKTAARIRLQQSLPEKQGKKHCI